MVKQIKGNMIEGSYADLQDLKENIVSTLSTLWRHSQSLTLTRLAMLRINSTFQMGSSRVPLCLIWSILNGLCARPLLLRLHPNDHGCWRDEHQENVQMGQTRIAIFAQK